MRAVYHPASGEPTPPHLGVLSNVLLGSELAANSNWRRKPETGRRFGPYEMRGSSGNQRTGRAGAVASAKVRFWAGLPVRSFQVRKSFP